MIKDKETRQCVRGLLLCIMALAIVLLIVVIKMPTKTCNVMIDSAIVGLNPGETKTLTKSDNKKYDYKCMPFIEVYANNVGIYFQNKEKIYGECYVLEETKSCRWV